MQGSKNEQKRIKRQNAKAVKHSRSIDNQRRLSRQSRARRGELNPSIEKEITQEESDRKQREQPMDYLINMEIDRLL